MLCAPPLQSIIHKSNMIQKTFSDLHINIQISLLFWLLYILSNLAFYMLNKIMKIYCAYFRFLTSLYLIRARLLVKKQPHLFLKRFFTLFQLFITLVNGNLWKLKNKQINIHHYQRIIYLHFFCSRQINNFKI